MVAPFPLAPTLGYFEATQPGDGLWRALGPEASWFTAVIVAFAWAARQPFAARFRDVGEILMAPSANQGSTGLCDYALARR